VGEKYILAVIEPAGGLPVLIPALGGQLDLEQLLAEVDGILFTGSPSNVEPRHYAGDASAPGTDHDPGRDATTLPLIPRAVAAGVPVFGICRGFQEMNVAFGGTLWQKVQEQPGKLDHREDKAQPLDVQYAPAHEVELLEGGVLRAIAGAGRVKVNSLHARWRARACAGTRGRGARPRRVDRGVPGGQGSAFRAGSTVAPRVAGDEQFLFACSVCGLRRRER